MKFKIESVMWWNKPIEEIYPALNFYEFEQKTSSGSYWTKYWGEIELNTLENLVVLEHNIGKQIILSKDESMPVITIYDDYIE